MAWFRFKNKESRFKKLLNAIIEKIERNWYLWAGVSLMFLSPHIHNALGETITHYAGVMFLITATANLLIHAFTAIEWRDWTGNNDFEILGKCVVIAAIFIGCSLVAADMWQQDNQTAVGVQLGEELKLGDSTNAKTIDSLKTKVDSLNADTLEALPQ